ncbi:MAG: hypothetical protein U0Y68_23630 [Blastocatellia bacterium]
MPDFSLFYGHQYRRVDQFSSAFRSLRRVFFNWSGFLATVIGMAFRIGAVFPGRHQRWDGRGRALKRRDGQSFVGVVD